MIKRIGNTPIQEKHKASCHCGAVVLELTLPDGVVDPRRCDCSLCRRRGAIVASVPLSGIRILQGEAALRCYQSCLEGVNPYELGEVPVLDGIHHPADR